MATQDVEAILKKAVSDDVFRISLARNFDKTVADHNLELTPEERDALVKVNWEAQLSNVTSLGIWVHIYQS